MSLTCSYYSPSAKRTVQTDPAAIPDLLARTDLYTWIDVAAPTESEKEWLVAQLPAGLRPPGRLGLPPTGIEFDLQAAVTTFAFPAVDFDEKRMAVVTNGVEIIARRTSIITVRERQVEAFDEIYRIWRDAWLPADVIPYLVFLHLHSVEESYLVALERIGGKIDSLRDDALRKAPGLPGTVELLRGQLYLLLKYLRPFSGAFHKLLLLQKGRPLYEGGPARHYYDEVSGNLANVKDEIFNYRDMLNEVLSTLGTTQANELNAFVTRLTVITIYLSSWALIAGVYGMNIRGLFPNTATRGGSLIVLAIFAGVTMLESWFFHKLGWFQAIMGDGTPRKSGKAGGGQ